jgi:hypothetical protein
MNRQASHPDGTRVEYVQHVQEQVEAVNLTRDETSTHESGDRS